MNGKVLYGINNIYTVSCNGKHYECRIKGKILDRTREDYNPLSPGDVVEFEIDTYSANNGKIVRRYTRQNRFYRFNKKKKAIQTVAANVDGLIVIASPVSPPFRPRFIDRVLVISEKEEITATIVLNKCDQGISQDVTERLDNYKNIGYEVIVCSAKTGEGLGCFREKLQNRTNVLIGQSGVGKSTLVNSVAPHINLKTGTISSKYNRGSHTTVYAEVVRLFDGTDVIDTPGIREIEIAEIRPQEVQFFFPDFEQYRNECDIYSCSHIHEPHCRVIEAVEEGKIHPDRYESYVRIYATIEETEKEWYG